MKYVMFLIDYVRFRHVLRVRAAAQRTDISPVARCLILRDLQIQLSSTQTRLLCLCCDLEGLGETADVVLDLAPVSQKLNICTVDQDSALLLQLDVLFPS